MNKEQAEELSNVGAEMSAMAEERYHMTMLDEASRIINGDSIMIASRDHVESLLWIIKQNTDLLDVADDVAELFHGTNDALNDLSVRAF